MTDPTLKQVDDIDPVPPVHTERCIIRIHHIRKALPLVLDPICDLLQDDDDATP